MKEIAVAAPAEIDEEAVEACFFAEGLRVTLKSTIAAYPGSIHWHLKQGERTGILEATLWQGRVWLKISAGRSAAWVEAAAERLKASLEALAEVQK